MSSIKRVLKWSCLVFALAMAACGTTEKDETASWTNEKLYAEAKNEADSGNYERADKLYEKLEGRAAGTLMSQQAELEHAYVKFKTGEKAQALAGIERFIKLHPSSPGLDYALYLQGLINFNDNIGFLTALSRQDMSERDQQASRDAYESFKRLVEQYPQSRYAEDATLRMNYIVNSLAKYEVHVAQYYYRRAAYVAAANRAQRTVTEFQNSPSAEEALAIMARSYDRLGLPQLRDDALRVLKESFPNSTYLSDPELAVQDRRKDRPWWQLW